MENGAYYDEQYFQALENRYYLGAHGERIRDIVSFLPTGARILDFGAGSGYFGYRATLMGNTVMAFDFSSDASRYMRSHYPSLHVIDREEDIKGPFDVILLNDVIEHIDYETQPTFISGLRKHLKTGGKLVVATDNFESFFYKNLIGKKLLAIDQRVSTEGIVYRSIKRSEIERPYYHNTYNDSHVGLLGRDQLVALFQKQNLTLEREKHGFIFRAPISTLVGFIFRLRLRHSVYEFSLD